MVATPTVPFDEITSQVPVFLHPDEELPIPGEITEHALQILEAADIMAGLCAVVRIRRELWQGVIIAQQGLDDQIVEQQYEGMAKIHGAALYMSTQDSRDGMRPLWRGLVHDIRTLVRDAGI